MFISHVESKKAVQSSVYSATAIGISWISSAGRIWSFRARAPSGLRMEKVLLLTEPCFTDKMRMTVRLRFNFDLSCSPINFPLCFIWIWAQFSQTACHRTDHSLGDPTSVFNFSSSPHPDIKLAYICPLPSMTSRKLSFTSLIFSRAFRLGALDIMIMDSKEETPSLSFSNSASTSLSSVRAYIHIIKSKTTLPQKNDCCEWQF